MVHSDNLWNLFSKTGDVNFYLEFKNCSTANCYLREKNENIEVEDTQNS